MFLGRFRVHDAPMPFTQSTRDELTGYQRFERSLLGEDADEKPAEDGEEQLSASDRFQRSSDLRWGRKTQRDIDLETLVRNVSAIRRIHERGNEAAHARESEALRERTGDTRSPGERFDAASRARWAKK